MNLWHLALGKRELGRSSTTGTPFGNSIKNRQNKLTKHLNVVLI
jgi:hypothetical protein